MGHVEEKNEVVDGISSCRRKVSPARPVAPEFCFGCKVALGRFLRSGEDVNPSRLFQEAWRERLCALKKVPRSAGSAALGKTASSKKSQHESNRTHVVTGPRATGSLRHPSKVASTASPFSLRGLVQAQD